MKMVRWMIGVAVMSCWGLTCFGTTIFADDFSGDLSQWTVNHDALLGSNLYVDNGQMVLNPPVGNSWPYLWCVEADSAARFTQPGRYELTWRQYNDIRDADNRNGVRVYVPGGLMLTWWDWSNAGEIYLAGQNLGRLDNGISGTWAAFDAVVEPLGSGSTHILVSKDGSIIFDQTVAQEADFATYGTIGFYTKYEVGSPTRIDDVQLTFEQPSFQGVVSLDGYLGDLDAVGVKFVLQPTTGGDNLTCGVMLSNDGVFTVPDVPPGTYNVFVKAYASLRTVMRDVPITAYPTVLTQPILLSGDDVNGDNRVSFEDFSILQNSYGQNGTATANPLAAAAASGGCGALGTVLMALLGLAGAGLGLRCKE